MRTVGLIFFFVLPPSMDDFTRLEFKIQNPRSYSGLDHCYDCVFFFSFLDPNQTLFVRVSVCMVKKRQALNPLL